MKRLNLVLGVLCVSVMLFTSCEREATETTTTKFAQEEVTSTFVAADDASTKEAMELLERIQNGEFDTATDDIQAMERACCLNKELNLDVHPYNPSLVQLNFKYDVGSTDQQVQVKHWLKVGGSYTYVGQNNINSSYTTCTSKSVNMGTGHLASGDYFSWSRIWGGSGVGYCGGSKTLTWTKP